MATCFCFGHPINTGTYKIKVHHSSVDMHSLARAMVCLTNIAQAHRHVELGMAEKADVLARYITLL